VTLVVIKELIILQDFGNLWTNRPQRWETKLARSQPFIVIHTPSRFQIVAKSTVVGPRFVSALHGAQEEPSREDSTKVTSRKEDLEASSFGAEGSVEETSKKENVEASSFGGERVIIVRDEETQGPLQKKVKKSALVLTILQSKGMEFEDVFLYDFFSASPYGSDFKILEELLEKYISSGLASV